MAKIRRSARSRAPARSLTRHALRWSVLRVILLTKGGEELVDPPGRDLLVSSQHTFAELATAIDRAFARWDRSHLHEFRLLDDRRLVMEDADELEEGDAARHLSEKAHTLSSAGLREGDTFVYVFDFGDQWEHACTVMRTDVDANTEWGDVGREIVPIFGWGTIPDQYARSSPDDD